MEKQEQIRVIKGLMHYLDTDTNVDAGSQVRNPVSSYTSREMAKREWQHFFQDYCHVLGMSGDLPKSGSFFTSKDLGKPILCTRDKDGHFHAFLNVCRHRGTVLEDSDRGEKHMFRCPFHAWGYANNGDLLSVPKEDHFGQVDKSCNGLVKLPCIEKFGLLWVNPNPEGNIDLDDQLGELATELASWDLEKFRFNVATRFDHPMNWKLAIDTFGETYHFNALHKNTLAQDFYGNAQMYDIYKRNHRMSLCLRNIDVLREMPENDWNVLLGALPVYYIFPNIQLILGLGGPTLVRVYPDGENPHNSFSQISFYVDPAFAELEMTEERRERYGDMTQRMQGFAEVIQMEDYVAAASSHQGILSGAQEYLTFGRNEPALHHYHNTYRDALGLPPLERISN
ncbi:MAG: aromatic ring-hydroxylating dioxygenase subunit alpha [Pseudomonadales bacterium]|nr:aromatic ring-hydroxylating dioxygenase subunit alpha [Pseudomonadales bacterium]